MGTGICLFNVQVCLVKVGSKCQCIITNVVSKQIFPQERERRSPAFNLHITTFPENNGSALQLFCHQEGIKVYAEHQKQLDGQEPFLNDQSNIQTNGLTLAGRKCEKINLVRKDIFNWGNGFIRICSGHLSGVPQ